ncbi:SdpI family protein [Bacillus atrophaeus]|uniref:SdpI family protein n=1 Tax=Bacillus atrophaeus TaxID=1452 RepID=UPI003D33BEEC
MIGLIGGGLMVIVGFLVKCFPPRHINSLYGYRTRLSMSEDTLWKEGNRYSANVMLISGLFVMGAGFVSDTILGPETIINIILQFIYLLTACSLTFFATQTRLKKLKHGGETDGRH